MNTVTARFSLLPLVLLLAACGQPANNHTLTIQKSGTGTGTVAGSGLSCGAACSLAFANGTQVVLTATTDLGSVFGGWAGCDTTTATTCTVAMTADRTVGAVFTATPAEVIRITENITVATTWQTGKVYEVTQPITVSAPLTIQPGVTVKFDANATMNVTSTLSADGLAATTPIVFTSANPSPAGGDWGGITLSKSGSVLGHCAVLYAGANDKAGLTIGDGFSASVTHCTFAHHRTPTDGLAAKPALDASGAASGTVIRDNLFYDNRIPLGVSTAFSIEANAFDNALAAPQVPQPNKYNGVFVEGCNHVTGVIAWPALAVPYVIGNPNNACNYVTLDDGGKLTIGSAAAKAVVKFFTGGNLDVRGLLIGFADFTSIKDDGRGGDTNGDALGTLPAGGDWGGITLAKTGSSFDHAGFFYGGAGDKSALVLNNNIAATITYSTFAHNVTPTATIRAAPALDASAGNASTVITHNTFLGNTVPLAINTTYSLDDSNTFTDGALPNKFQAIVVQGCGHVASAITWAATKVPLVIGDPASACSYVTIDSGGQLTIADGVVLKFFPGGIIQANGAMIANGTTQIVFTAFADDANGGDTNADGAATAPAGGNWNGIRVAVSGSNFNKVQFLYGGGATDGASTPSLYVSSGKSVSVNNSLFAHHRTTVDALTAPAALDLSDGVPVDMVIHNNRFYDCTVPLAINGTLSVDDTNTFDTGVPSALFPNKYNGIFVQGCTQVTASTQWLATKVPFVIGDPTSACRYVTVSPAGHLTLGSNVTMKFFLNGMLDVKAGATFTVNASDWLTSIKDDHLNDTNADEGQTTPANGDWRGVKYGGTNPTCDESSYMHYFTPNNADHSCSW